MTKRILAIDDDEATLDLYRLIFEEEGHEVFLLSSVDENLNDIEQLHPDVIILDFMLQTPQETENLLHRLQRYSSTASIPLLLCTAASKAALEQADYLQAQDIPIVSKPFDLDDLLRIVRSLLQVDNRQRLSA